MLKLTSTCTHKLADDIEVLLYNINLCNNALHQYHNMWVILGVGQWFGKGGHIVRDTYGFNKRAKVLC